MKKILVIDDDDIIKEMFSDALTQFGHEVYTAKNGSDALRVIKATPEIDIIILDLLMPVMNGQETCCQIKRLLPDVEIIVVSTFLDDVAIKELAGMGVKHFLPKPSSLKFLQDIINNHVGIQK